MDANQDYGGYLGVLNVNGSPGGITTVLGTRGAQVDLPALFARSGNIGIGASDPNTALDVSGAFNLRGTSAPALSPPAKITEIICSSTGAACNTQLSGNTALRAGVIRGG